MSTTETTPQAANSSAEKLTYDVFVNDPPPQDGGSFRTASRSGSRPRPAR